MPPPDLNIPILLAAEWQINNALARIRDAKAAQLDALRRADRAAYASLFACIYDAVADGQRIDAQCPPLREHWQAIEPPAAARCLRNSQERHRGALLLEIADLDAMLAAAGAAESARLAGVIAPVNQTGTAPHGPN